MRVGLIFDDLVRPDTAGRYCLRAMRSLTDVVHFRPRELGTSSGDCDAYVWIDDGLAYRLPNWCRPCVLWAIDTHICPDRLGHRCEQADFVFTAQRSGVEVLRPTLRGKAEWLPLACDPDSHASEDSARTIDIGFVGNLHTEARRELAAELSARFPKCVFGQRYGRRMAELYGRSRMAVNLSVNCDLNMRVFESLCAGALLLTDPADGLEELFTDRRHLAVYRSREELVDLAQYYLSNSDEAKVIADAGRATALEHHTYRHRMERVLNEVKELVASGPRPVRPLPRWRVPVSIIIPTLNGSDLTERCVNSILHSTLAGDFEIIVVDDGSSDDSKARLGRLASVRFIALDQNMGFPSAVNAGLRAARGEHAILLNNDTVVTRGWLERLLRPLALGQGIGLVGPCSNSVSGPQEVECDYESLEGLPRFAERFSESNRGQLRYVPRLVGFCLLIARTVLDRIGLLDEGFGIGMFDDDDYSLRALSVGFQAVIACDCFVHHDGSATFRREGIDTTKLLVENEAKFGVKHGAGGIHLPV